ncbi:non-ribosomal peptide synthetase [Actinophytocola sp.]|uniref:non-ribosomal peptide synthetase n=1 Tax=Actinophytocola sp. TaxID=1872138 RepID=UPI002ED1C364
MSSPSIESGGMPRNGAVHELFRDWAERTPDAPALHDGDLRWSYAELDRAADEVADALRDHVRTGDLVGVCLDHSAALVAVALAVARLGAVYLSFGTAPGEQRLRAATSDLRVRCLIGDPARWPATDQKPLPLAVPVTGAKAAPSVVAALTADAATAPRGTHYAVLTSGSTGDPKAVAVGAESFGALLRWYRDLVELGPGERHSFLMGAPFDAHVMEMWAVLTAGAALSVAPPDVQWDSRALTDWWRHARITAAFLPTPMAEPVLDRPWPAGLALRHLCIGGDRLRRWPAADVTARVHNAYGPAEATVVTTVHPMPPGGASDTGGHPPIGRPIPGATVLVVGADGQPVPRGQAGELVIGGPCLALGYFDDELTARRFVSPPTGSGHLDRVYRTGDRVVMRPDGVLEFLGRLDDQVKVDGVRIEPAEVEAALEREPRIRRAVVVARTDGAGASQLVAFVQPVPDGSAPATAELRDHARRWLPAQAVPARIEVVDRFPLTPNGKVDRRALLAATDARGTAHAATDGSPTERAVVSLCREILGLPGLGPGDNFVAVGGNSVGAARLLAALEERYDVRLRAPQLLRQPDLRHVAMLVAERTARGEVSR